MKQYHKIQTVYFRDPANRNKTLLDGQWAKPEFESLRNAEWVWTEKIDGTNIRIMWDGEKVRFGGKTDNAQIPTILIEYLQDTFTTELFTSTFPESDNVCLYGEGYGKKIQKGHNYLPDSASFILFDCRIGDWWLERNNIEDIATTMDINIVPVMGIGPLTEAIDFVRKGYKSTIAENKDYIAEGLIMKPKVELFNRKGERIVSKIKYKDFHRG